MYSNTPPPTKVDEIPSYLRNETQRLEDELRNHETDSIILTKHHVAPSKAVEGQLKFFDQNVFGTEGIYQYRGITWVFVG